MFFTKSQKLDLWHIFYNFKAIFSTSSQMNKIKGPTFNMPATGQIIYVIYNFKAIFSTSSQMKKII